MHTCIHIFTRRYLGCDIHTRAHAQGSLWNNVVERVSTPSLPTKSFDFRGFDSSRLLIQRGGNSHIRKI